MRMYSWGTHQPDTSHSLPTRTCRQTIFRDNILSDSLSYKWTYRDLRLKSSCKYHTYLHYPSNRLLLEKLLSESHSLHKQMSNLPGCLPPGKVCADIMYHSSSLVSEGALLELRGMCKESFSLIEILKCKTPKSYNETRQPPVRLYLERGDNDCIFCLTLIYLFIISCWEPRNCVTFSLANF